VLSGNEETLKKYYESKRRSPILGSEAFIEQVIRSASAAREHPRYERRVVEVKPERVINEVARQYKVAREEIFRGVRGRENEARKVALYLIKRCCDRTLPEMAEYFGIGNYSTISGNCRAIESQMARDKKLRDRIEKVVALY
jgi:chromosomal replication initiation ATPase DnaA